MLVRYLFISRGAVQVIRGAVAKIQGWVIRHRRIIRRIVFITYLTVFFKLLRIIRFWALNEFCSHKPPRAPQKHSQAL
jgi:hypothetical protein